ncbi:MAG: ferritin family protein [Deltaproteobacteria bacterium]|nr:ferritin family protein [Deltaproteobacteria bacterium]
MPNRTDRCLKMLAEAMKEEEKSLSLYENAAAVCSLELGKEMFRILLGQEKDHVKRLRSVYDSLQRGEAWADLWKPQRTENEDLREFLQNQITLLGHKIRHHSGDLQTLEIGVTMEQESIDFYDERLQKATDPLEQQFLASMITEERSHFVVLQDLKLFLTDPESWFIEKEHHAMDGA